MKRLDPEKEIVFSRHLAFRWAKRVSNQLSIEDAEDQRTVVRRLRGQIVSGEYALIDDGEEFDHEKYRLVCNIWGETLTFVVINAKKLVFKTVWPSKKWEVKKLEDEMSNM